MDLTPVSSKLIKKIPKEDSSLKKDEGVLISRPHTLQETLEFLRKQPSREALIYTLQWLSAVPEFKKPSPVNAQIISALVNLILPDFWRLFEETELESFCGVLRSVAGIGALLVRLKALITDHEQRKGKLGSSDSSQHIIDTLQVLSRVFEPKDALNTIWNQAANYVRNSTQETLLWRELINNVASGKIISITAQAETVIGIPEHDRSWLSQGSTFASWLGLNIVGMALDTKDGDKAKRTALAQLLGRSFSLGYSKQLTAEMFKELLKVSKYSVVLPIFLEDLPRHEKRQLFEGFVAATSDLLNLTDSHGYDVSAVELLASSVKLAAAVIKSFAGIDENMRLYLFNHLTQGRTAMINSLGLRRAACAVLAEYDDDIRDVLEKTMQLFGDPLFIKHGPVIRQEATAQILLLSAGYIEAKNHMEVFMLGRSSYFTHGVSNRLAASSPRARWLGMTVAMAISNLIDEPGASMKFDTEDMNTDEARWYRPFTHTSDPVGKIDDLKKYLKEKESLDTKAFFKVPPTTPKSRSKVPTNSISTKPPTTKIAGPRIVEVLDSEDEDSKEDDGLKPYAKPDSDPEDESEDPTLINRNKPTPPVYIRDLMMRLRDTENHDAYLLAVSSAADLIRRKSSFGHEVTDNWEELASQLTGLQDPFEFEDFTGMRQRALIAVLLSQPTRTGPWFVRAFFDGDYSISQRLALLSAIGLGARHLAGFQDDVNYGGLPQPKESFPSKTLPERLHNLFIGSASPVDTISQNLEKNMVEPLALKAADDLTGPSILKVRTFSSRIEKEKQRKKPISNELAKIVGDSFFFPLTGRWWTQLQNRGPRNVMAQPLLLQTYLKTLALLMNASGPSTLSLPQMTSELWDLLLSVRTSALGDVAVLESVLFAMLTLLDVNEDKQRLAREHAKELLETQEWVKLVLENSAGGSGEEDRVKGLAAAVGVRCSEVVEKYQRMLLGDLVDFQ